jgi:hypothetical protein
MNAGVAKLIPQDLVYSRTAPNVAHVSPEQPCAKITNDRATKRLFRRYRMFCDAQRLCAGLSYRTFADERERSPHRRVGIAGRRRVINIR